jgi:methylmalonyl-CoA mutase N-terminal domain/subunit
VDSAYKVPPDEKRFGAIERVRALRGARDQGTVTLQLRRLAETARGGQSIVRPAIEAAKALATVGEMVGAIRMGCGLPFDPYGRIPAPAFLQGVA